MRRSFLPLTLLALFVTAGCAGSARAPDTVSLYRYAGSSQCEPASSTISTVRRQFSQAGVPLREASCGVDGKARASMCGVSDGKLFIVDVAPADAGSAAALGFQPLERLDTAARVACPESEGFFGIKY
jgi:hypothetical protein